MWGAVDIHDSWLVLYASLASRLRRKRFRHFRSLIATLPRPIRVLDVGGTEAFWEQMGFYGAPGVEIVLLNRSKIPVTHSGFKSLVGDARNMGQFRDGEFDVVFSNSVIEHVGDYEDQRRMAQEIRRLSRRYYLQTPNRHFPIEPHFAFPFFQFLPVNARAWLVSHFDLGCYRRISSKKEALRAVSAIRLLNRKEMLDLFPDGAIVQERLLGLTKSFTACRGWSDPIV